MAWTASKSAQAVDFLITVVKGNELDNIIIEGHSAQEFQPNLYDGKDANKRIQVDNQLAALGIRGDYFLIEIPYVLGTGTADTRSKNSVYVELLEHTSVPPAVQFDTYGAFSPFVTPKMSVTKDMLLGIDHQQITAINNVGFPDVDADGTTPVNQKVRGVEDSRITCYYSLADPMSANGSAYMKIKPLWDSVFVIPADATIWLDNSDDGMGETGS